MAATPENTIGTVELGRSTSLIFSVQSWKGRQLAHVRKFVATGKYEGPTRSGLAMSGEVLSSVIDALEQLKADAPGREEREFARVSKRDEVEIVVKTIPPDDLKSLPSVDVREFIDTPEYAGPTRKGIRFPWNKLAEVISLMRAQAKQLGAKEKKQETLFAGSRPKWVERSDSTTPSSPSAQDSILSEHLPNGPKRFPDDFVDGTVSKATILDLPTEPIDVTQQPGGKFIVRSHFGFSHPVRNAVEGNFILYAHLRGLRKVSVPTEMPALFRAVTAYKNYLRDLRLSLVRAYEQKSGHRPMADHQAKEVFRQFGLPWIIES